MARPYCQKGYEPELYTNDSPTGAELTASIYNLAKKIDDPSEERPYTDLIIEWCKKYGHPYAIDSIHAYLVEPQYKLEEDGYFIEKDATFSIEEFMADLERFYQAMRMQFAFEQMWLGNDEPALTLHEDGRYFAEGYECVYCSIRSKITGTRFFEMPVTFVESCFVSICPSVSA